MFIKLNITHTLQLFMDPVFKVLVLTRVAVVGLRRRPLLAAAGTGSDACRPETDRQTFECSGVSRLRQVSRHIQE